MLRGVNTPAETMMIMLNANFSITRNAPRAGNRHGNYQNFNFSTVRSVNTGRSFV